MDRLDRLLGRGSSSALLDQIDEIDELDDPELDLLVRLLGRGDARRTDELIFQLLERELKETDEILLPRDARFRAIEKSVRIDGPPRYRDKVELALSQIASTRTGKKLLAGLERTGRQVTIRPSLDGKNHARPLDREDATADIDGMRGPGSSGIIRFDPESRRVGRGDKAWMRRPPYVGLFHELVHAWDYMHGALEPGRTNGTKNCELSAVGLPFRQDGDLVRRADGISENDLRAEVGLPKRTSYGGSGGAGSRERFWADLYGDQWLES
jgi:hypothetical protein